MTGPVTNRSGGSGPTLKGRFSKYAQEKRTKSDSVESRSPSSSDGDTFATTVCTRDEPEEGEILLAPTARRLSELSPPLTSFGKRKRRITVSRNSSTKRQTQIRSPHQSKKCMKNLPPALSGSGTTVHSPWVSPSGAQVYYPYGAQAYHPPAITDECRMDIIQTDSTQEQDLPHVISPAYKFLPIEMTERLEEEEANELFSSFDYDICSDEYMLSHQDQEVTTKAKTSKRKQAQNKNKKKKQQKNQIQHVDKYSWHTSHSPVSESPSTQSWWTNVSQCCH